jgi:HEAT repeats
MRTASIALALLLFAAVVSAQQPRLVHSSVTSVAASSDLGAQIRGARTKFIGYAVPEIAGERVMCCFDTFGEFRSGGKCSLDREGSYFTNDDRDDPHPVATGVFAILYRVENGEIAKVRSYSMECVLDANGAAVTWVEGVDPRKSVALLASIIGRAGHHSDSVMSTLAMLADPSATTELERMLQSADAPEETRGHAAFWLGQIRGRRGYEDVLALARSQSASPHLREKAVFAVSQLPDDQSIPMLIDLMKSHRDPNVRKKAAFWLGQKHDPRALAAIEDILRK